MNAKPLPRPSADSRAFWDGCARGELLCQRCRACRRPQFPPRRLCAHCGGTDIAWEKSAGLGTVHTFTVVHRAPSAAFRREVPYVIALIDLDEGFRIMTNLRGAEALTGAAIGARVRIGFETTGADSPPLPQAWLCPPRDPAGAT